MGMIHKCSASQKSYHSVPALKSSKQVAVKEMPALSLHEFLPSSHVIITLFLATSHYLVLLITEVVVRDSTSLPSLTNYSNFHYFLIFIIILLPVSAV